MNNKSPESSHDQTTSRLSAWTSRCSWEIAASSLRNSRNTMAQ